MTTMKEVNEYIAHYGIRGQKWGVRRKRGSDGTVSKESPSSDAVKVADNISRSKISGRQALSNKELQEVITRANLETQYSRITATPKQKAINWATDMILSIGKDQSRAIVSGQAVQFRKDFVNRASPIEPPKWVKSN